MASQNEIYEQINQVRAAGFASRVADLNALREALGEQVVEIVTAARGRKVAEEWRAIAEQHGRNDIQGLRETLWEYCREAGFEFTAAETAEGTQFRVTRCPLAEMARAVGAADWGYHLYCADDPHIIAGFNPAIGFRRTQTLMDGHDCCDHFYFLLASSPPAKA